MDEGEAAGGLLSLEKWVIWRASTYASKWVFEEGWERKSELEFGSMISMKLWMKTGMKSGLVLNQVAMDEKIALYFNQLNWKEDEECSCNASPVKAV